MAARHKTRIDEKTREKIKASQILNRLNKHILNEDTEKEVMSASQVNAALGVLKKILPDLKAVEHSGEISIPQVIVKNLSGQ